jgi:hypothetical protein
MHLNLYDYYQQYREFIPIPRKQGSVFSHNNAATTEKDLSAQFYACNVTGFFQDSLSHLAVFVKSSAHYGKFK